MNYHNKKFKLLSNSSNGDVSENTIFEFRQLGKIVSANYSGGGILQGNLIGLVDEHGNIDMRYHHVNDKGEIMTGKSDSRSVVLDSGKAQIHDHWQWTSGDYSSGNSDLEEF